MTIGRGKRASSAASERALDHMIFKFTRVDFAHRPTARRLSRFVNALAVAADEIMPFRQRLPRGAETIGTSLGEPFEPFKVGGIEAHAVADPFHAIGIIETASVAPIEQLASDVGRVEDAGIGVFQLVHAAAPATVAKRLPFAAVERREVAFPERLWHIHDKASLALLVGGKQAKGTGRKSMHRIITMAIGLSITLAGSAMAQAPGQSKGEAFVEAIQKEDAGMALHLLRENPTVVNARNSKGDTALLIAIRREDREWASFLLGSGADLELAASNGDTPIIAAARAGFNEAVGSLIKAGARIDAANKLGETALIVAVHTRNLRLTNTLLKAGADPDKNDYSGHSARDYAKLDTRTRQLGELFGSAKAKK